MRWRGALIAAFALASCAFGSERPLFSSVDAVFPFADGALYDWRPHPADEEFVVRFRRVGDRYELVRLDEAEEEPMRVLFAPIAQTREDDYVAQLNLHRQPDNDAAAYAFLWPLGEGRYRVFFEPGALDGSRDLPSDADRYCTPAQYNGCTFQSAEAVRDYYLNVLYPAFSSGQIPARYLSITPGAGDASPPRPRKPRAQ